MKKPLTLIFKASLASAALLLVLLVFPAKTYAATPSCSNGSCVNIGACPAGQTAVTDLQCNDPPNRACCPDLDDVITDGVTENTLDQLNPLKIAGSPYADQFKNPGGIFSRFLRVFAIPGAGLILFIMLVWGGFEIVMGAASKKSIDAGKQRITAALVGFLLLFASFWLIKIIEAIFGVVIV